MCDMIGAKVIAHERSRTDGSTSTGDDLRGLDVSSFTASVPPQQTWEPARTASVRCALQASAEEWSTGLNTNN